MYNVIMTSEVFADEEFGEYDSLIEAYQAVARLVAKAIELDDGIVRGFEIVSAEED